MVENCLKGRLKPLAVQVPRLVVPKQLKGCLGGHLWNQEKSNQEIIRSNMVLQKFCFGKTHAGGVGWVGKCCSALGIRQRGWRQPLLWHPWNRTLHRAETPKENWDTQDWCLDEHSTRGAGWGHTETLISSLVSLCCWTSWTFRVWFFSLILPSFLKSSCVETRSGLLSSVFLSHTFHFVCLCIFSGAQ